MTASSGSSPAARSQGTRFLTGPEQVGAVGGHRPGERPKQALGGKLGIA